jgi:hypothetical protein
MKADTKQRLSMFAGQVIVEGSIIASNTREVDEMLQGNMSSDDQRYWLSSPLCSSEWEKNGQAF